MAYVIAYDIDTTRFEKDGFDKAQLTQLYRDVEKALVDNGFERLQKSVFRFKYDGMHSHDQDKIYVAAMCTLAQVPRFLDYASAVHRFESNPGSNVIDLLKVLRDKLSEDQAKI